MIPIFKLSDGKQMDGVVKWSNKPIYNTCKYCGNQHTLQTCPSCGSMEFKQ